MIHHRFSAPEMKNLSIPLHEYMHHWQLHIIGISLAFVIGLIGRIESRYQFHLRPSTLLCPVIDPVGRSFGNCNECGVSRNLIPGAIKPINKRRAGRTWMVPAWTKHKGVE